VFILYEMSLEWMISDGKKIELAIMVVYYLSSLFLGRLTL
jgi:hypothetical protein